MQQKTANKGIIFLAYLSITPLFFALFLALYAALDGPAISGYFINFARINAYIYSHSYAALLLCVFAGIQIGMTAQLPNRWYVLFNFCLLFLAWYSYHSFADAQGLMLLICCWLAAFFIDISAQQNNLIHSWYAQLKLKINLITIILLSLIVFLNK